MAELCLLWIGIIIGFFGWVWGREVRIACNLLTLLEALVNVELCRQAHANKLSAPLVIPSVATLSGWPVWHWRQGTHSGGGTGLSYSCGAWQHRGPLSDCSVHGEDFALVLGMLQLWVGSAGFIWTWPKRCCLEKDLASGQLCLGAVVSVSFSAESTQCDLHWDQQKWLGRRWINYSTLLCLPHFLSGLSAPA